MRHLPTYLLASLTLLSGVATWSAAGAQETGAQDPTQAKPQLLADQLAESTDGQPAAAPPTAEAKPPAAETPAPAATEVQTQPAPAAAAKTETQPLTMPTPSTAGEVTAPVVTPSRGATMAAVREKFGAPTQEAAAVGTPPISRWEYTSYVVYFENDRVLHTVVK